MTIQKQTYYAETKAVVDEKNTWEVMISTEATDRDGDVLIAGGVDLSAYQRNPVVLWAHNHDLPPVAKANVVEVLPGAGIRAEFVFPDEGVSEHADTIHRLWKSGFLNATSVGFIPKAYEPRETGSTFTEWELIEFSIVPVPANQEALRLALKTIENQPEQVVTKTVDAEQGGEQHTSDEPTINAPSHNESELLDELLRKLIKLENILQEM